MDKELLRIVIIATGLLVILVMIAWSYLKEKKSERQRDLHADNPPLDFDEEYAGDDFSAGPGGPDDFDIIPLGPARKNQAADPYFDEDIEESDEDEVIESQRLITPSLIQFGIVANREEGFNGVDLFRAFETVGLSYGSMKIFERLDADDRVDFAAACMVEPGTFPEEDIDEFYCPGIVLFMQPGQLEDAQSVFDDLIETMRLLAEDLDGEILDNQRRPLTDAKVTELRRTL